MGLTARNDPTRQRWRHGSRPPAASETTRRPSNRSRKRFRFSAPLGPGPFRGPLCAPPAARASVPVRCVLVSAGSGLPVPSRRTLAPALQASARSMLPSLRHPACARPATPLDWHGQPRAVKRLTRSGTDSSRQTPRATPRTNTAARRCGRRQRPKAGVPPSPRGPGMAPRALKSEFILAERAAALALTALL